MYSQRLEESVKLTAEAAEKSANVMMTKKREEQERVLAAVREEQRLAQERAEAEAGAERGATTPKEELRQTAGAEAGAGNVAITPGGVPEVHGPHGGRSDRRRGLREITACTL